MSRKEMKEKAKKGKRRGLKRAGILLKLVGLGVAAGLAYKAGAEKNAEKENQADIFEEMPEFDED